MPCSIPEVSLTGFSRGRSFYERKHDEYLTDCICRGFAEVLGFDLTNGKITIPGEGVAPISWTTRGDIGRFVAYVLTALPKEKLEWRIFRIEGDRTVSDPLPIVHK